MMKLLFKISLVVFIAGFISSCGNSLAINYRESIVGEWQLKNAGELQRYFRDEKEFVLKNATMVFNNNGTMETRLLKSDKKSWIRQSGEWDMPKEGGLIWIKADKGPLDEKLLIEFADERTFYITSNDLIFQFVKM